MADFLEQIVQIEKEIRETPYHKGTEHHIGKLRARLARLKDRELESELNKGGGGGGGYAVKKQGDATIVLIGPPSAGKSTLINQLTNAESRVAPYSFTTVSVIPGMMKYQDAYIQILDVPGLIEGARLGKGRGKEVLSVARGADLLLIMTDVDRISSIDQMVKELEGAGIRINQEIPKVSIEKKVGGPLNVHTNIAQSVDKETVKEVAREFGIKSGDVTLNERVSLEQLVDSFSPNRVYIPALFVINKIDTNKSVSIDKDLIGISAESGLNLEMLVKLIWERLSFVRVYLVRRDDEPNKENPLIVTSKYNLSDVALKIGDEFALEKKFAKIWGPSARYPGQEVSLTTPVKEDMQIRFV